MFKAMPLSHTKAVGEEEGLAVGKSVGLSEGPEVGMVLTVGAGVAVGA